MFHFFKKIGFLSLLLIALIGSGCGGGDATTTNTVRSRLVGEIIVTPDQLIHSPFQVNAVYSGDMVTSRAMSQTSGVSNVLDLLFLVAEGDAEQRLMRLQEYITKNSDLLTSGVRVLVADEVFLETKTTEELAQRWVTIQHAIALVRQHLPKVRVGITVSPYATFNRPETALQTMGYIKKTIALVDWVATDPYWFGDPSLIPALHTWSNDFHVMAKEVLPTVETWFVAQAFKDPLWDVALFNRFIAKELLHAEQYDHIIFFGWQFVSELNPNTAGQFFPAETKQLYQKFFK